MFDGRPIDLDAAVAMPDHVHVIFRIIGHTRLGPVLRRIKGASAAKINRMVKREGSLWLDENFDHVIRHETEWLEKMEYVRNNPRKSGIVNEGELYPWLYVRDIAG